MSSRQFAAVFVSLLVPAFLGLWLAKVFTSTISAAPGPIVTVDTLIDEADGSCADGDCSLRDAIATASSGDIINFSISGTIVLSSTPHFLGELVLDRDLTITGTMPITVSGNNATRVFNALAGNITLDSLHIISGAVTSSDCGVAPTLCGSGIILQSNSVSITVANSILSGNTAQFGGAIYNSGGTLTLMNSTLISNSALSNAGGGIYNLGGTVELNNSTLLDNSAQFGGGISTFQGPVTLNYTTLSGNSATDTGGGIYNFEGALTISNSTISGNSALDDGGGIYSNNPSGNCMALAGTSITNSTLSNNSATETGGGIHNQNGVMEITHSTITTNTAGVDGAGILSFNNSVTCARIGNSIIAGNNAGMGCSCF